MHAIKRPRSTPAQLTKQSSSDRPKATSRSHNKGGDRHRVVLSHSVRLPTHHIAIPRAMPAKVGDTKLSPSLDLQPHVPPWPMPVDDRQVRTVGVNTLSLSKNHRIPVSCKHLSSRAHHRLVKQGVEQLRVS